MSTNPGAYPPAPPPERSPAKKSNILLWILVAVGSLFLIAFAVVISGGLFIAHKVKDFAEVRDGKVVVKKEGKDVVISSSGKDSDGSVEIKSAGGSMKFGGGAGAKIPAWVPAYPAAAAQGVYSAQTKEGATGSFRFQTSDSPAKVAEFYRQEFQSAGLKITSSVQTVDANMVGAEDEDKKHSAAVMISAKDGKTSVSVTYVER